MSGFRGRRRFTPSLRPIREIEPASAEEAKAAVAESEAPVAGQQTLSFPINIRPPSDFELTVPSIEDDPAPIRTPEMSQEQWIQARVKWMARDFIRQGHPPPDDKWDLVKEAALDYAQNFPADFPYADVLRMILTKYRSSRDARGRPTRYTGSLENDLNQIEAFLENNDPFILEDSQHFAQLVISRYSNIEEDHAMLAHLRRAAEENDGIDDMAELFQQTSISAKPKPSMLATIPEEPSSSMAGAGAGAGAGSSDSPPLASTTTKKYRVGSDSPPPVATPYRQTLMDLDNQLEWALSADLPDIVFHDDFTELEAGPASGFAFDSRLLK